MSATHIWKNVVVRGRDLVEGDGYGAFPCQRQHKTGLPAQAEAAWRGREVFLAVLVSSGWSAGADEVRVITLIWANGMPRRQGGGYAENMSLSNLMFIMVVLLLSDKKAISDSNNRLGGYLTITFTVFPPAEATYTPWQ